jgi:hypothetical protein
MDPIDELVGRHLSIGGGEDQKFSQNPLKSGKCAIIKNVHSPLLELPFVPNFFFPFPNRALLEG